MERVIQFEGCHNFRDLGGYPAEDGKRVRWRRLFRSAHHSEMTSRDIVTVREELGIASVIDLRRPREVESGRTPLADMGGVTYFHFNFIGTVGEEYRPASNDRMVDLYLQALEPAGPAISQTINLLAQESSYPAVFHCAGGKDRTGILSAVVLGLLGVSEDDIADDYALTQSNQPLISPEKMEEIKEEVIRKGYPKDLLYARRETMIEFLVATRARYGSIGNFVTRNGVNGDTLEQLQEVLLEKRPSWLSTESGAWRRSD